MMEIVTGRVGRVTYHLLPAASQKASLLYLKPWLLSPIFGMSKDELNSAKQDLADCDW